MMIKLDILAIVAHPDDAELACAGTLLKEKVNGKKIGIVDLTQGELGSRGSAELRYEEAKRSSDILGLDVRANVKLADGFFEETEANLLAVIKYIRKYRPEILITNAVTDRHPDHGRASALVQRAAFLSGLLKIETMDGDLMQEHWRPKVVYHMIQDRYIEPDFSVDITSVYDQKMEAIKAFSSQFFNSDNVSAGTATPISSPNFIYFLEARAREFGRTINATYAEGFTVERTPGVKSLFDLS
jgi:bacillithiol biosynthesis deacetylase BshB1